MNRWIALSLSAAMVGCAAPRALAPAPASASPPAPSAAAEAPEQPLAQAEEVTPAEPFAPPPAQPVEAVPTPASPLGDSAARRAASYVGLSTLKRVTKRVTDDCSGFIRLVYEQIGVALEGAVPTLYERAKEAGALYQHRPARGDLVFFRETYDRNRDGKRNDGMTHVGVVESVADDGTVTFVHRGHKGVARSRLNLLHPRQREGANGTVLNDWLRAAGATRAYTAGELCTGFARLEALL